MKWNPDTCQCEATVNESFQLVAIVPCQIHTQGSEEEQFVSALADNRLKNRALAAAEEAEAVVSSWALLGQQNLSLILEDSSKVAEVQSSCDTQLGFGKVTVSSL